MRSPVCSTARSLVLCWSLVLVAALPAAAAEERHPFSVRDLVAMERLAGPQPSPDGRQVVFTRRVYDPGANKNFTSLWVVPINGGEPRRLTAARASDTSPRWSPDGRTIAFVSDRSGSAQIWMTVAGHFLLDSRAGADTREAFWSRPDRIHRARRAARTHPNDATFPSPGSVPGGGGQRRRAGRPRARR